MNIYESLEELIQYGLKKDLIEKWDVDFVRNDLLSIFELDEWQHVEVADVNDESPVRILSSILDWAAEQGKLPHNSITYRDLLDTEIMGAFVARPSTIIAHFYRHLS